MEPRRILVICMTLAMLAVFGLAQVSTSRLEGLIQDQSGAVVVGAKITAINNRTAVRLETTSNEQGLFVLPSLPPSEYTVEVEAAGFRKAVRVGVVLNVGGTVSEIIKLEIGALTESVVVEADAVRVQTTDASISRVITLRDIDVLAQLGRAPMALAIFATPGIQIDPADGTFSRVNGLRQGSNNSTLDGIDVNDALVPRLGLSLTAVNTDSVEEFRVVASGGKAEYGRNAGAQIEMISRSGGNVFHGNAFDYLRNTVLNANTFFNNSAVPAIQRPVFIQNLFGGSLGGPILRDRTFIFGNFQGRRTPAQISRNRTVLTPQAKAGLFRWKPPGSSEIQSFDIVRNDPRGKGIDPQVAAILKLLPDPNNTDVGDGLNNAGFRFNNPNGSREDQMTIKADHNVWSGHRVFFRWSWQRNQFIDSLNNADARYPGQAQGTQGGRRWGYSIGSDWSITTHIVNSLRIGYQSASVDFLRPGRLPGSMLVSNSWTDPLNPGFSQGRNSPVRQYTDNLTLVRGVHTFKGGLSWRFTKQWGYNDAGIYPNVTFARSFGAIPPATIGPSTNIASADRQRFEDLYNDLLGRMNQVTQTFYSDLEKFQAAGAPRVRTHNIREYGYFFQDDWKIRPNLTLNLGLRYEFSGVPFEANRLQGTLDKAALINAVSQIADLKVQRSTEWYNNDYNNFAPRIGLAWDVRGDGKMAIRANWGLFYDRIIGAAISLTDGNTPGFSQAVPVYPNNVTNGDVRVTDGIPLPQQPAAPVVLLPSTRSTSTVVFAPNLSTGYVQHYSLTIQREVLRNTVIEVGYVGTRGTKMFVDLNLNQARIYQDFLPAFRELQAFRASGAPVSAGNTLVRIFGSASAAISSIGASIIDQGTVGGAADSMDRANYTRYAAAGLSDFYLRNYPQFNQVIMGTNDGRSYYNSLQLSLRRQAGAVRFNANYTFSKSMDNISVDGNGFTSPIDNFNLALNRGRGDYDRPHVFNYALVYTLPIGKGRRLAGNAPRWADSLIGGWDVGLTSIWQSGGVVTYSSGRATGPATINTWANYTGDRNIGAVARQGNGVFWLTPEQISAFSFPAAGQIGSSGRNAFRGPRFFNMDMSLTKRFRITEQHRVSFRAEAYTLLNNTNFGTLGTSLVTPASFGKLSGTVGNARILQLALRYDF